MKIAEVQWDQMDFLSEEVSTPRGHNQQGVAVGGPHADSEHGQAII